jgi:hypothetical protein
MENIVQIAPVPGHRIADYRNSAPRTIRLLGLGERGGKIAREVARRGHGNVEVETGTQPLGWDEIARDRPDGPANMIVVVCGEGDERLFNPRQGKPDMLVTFVIIKRSGATSVADGPQLAAMRGLSDLFVTTSDADYVADLIDNLAS